MTERKSKTIRKPPRRIEHLETRSCLSIDVTVAAFGEPSVAIADSAWELYAPEISVECQPFAVLRLQRPPLTETDPTESDSAYADWNEGDFNSSTVSGEAARLGGIEFRIVPLEFRHLAHLQPQEQISFEPVDNSASSDSVAEDAEVEFDDSPFSSSDTSSPASDVDSTSQSDVSAFSTSFAAGNVVVAADASSISEQVSSVGGGSFARRNSLIELPFRQFPQNQAVRSSSTLNRTPNEPSKSEFDEIEGWSDEKFADFDFGESGHMQSLDDIPQVILERLQGSPSFGPLAYYLEYSAEVESRFARLTAEAVEMVAPSNQQPTPIVTCPVRLALEGGFVELASNASLPDVPNDASDSVPGMDRDGFPAGIQRIQMDASLGLFQTLEVALSELNIPEPSQAFSLAAAFVFVAEALRRHEATKSTANLKKRLAGSPRGEELER